MAECVDQSPLLSLEIPVCKVLNWSDCPKVHIHITCYYHTFSFHYAMTSTPDPIAKTFYTLQYYTEHACIIEMNGTDSVSKVPLLRLFSPTCTFSHCCCNSYSGNASERCFTILRDDHHIPVRSDTRERG